MFQLQIENQNGRNGFTVLELLVVVAIIAVLILLLLPAVSFANPQVLADGVVLYNGTLLDGVRVVFRPVLDDGAFGDQAFDRLTPDPGVGCFEVVTTSAWRRENSPTGLFVVTLQLEPELLTEDDEERQRLATYLDAETSPLRIHVPEGGAHNLHLEIAE